MTDPNKDLDQDNAAPEGEKPDNAASTEGSDVDWAAALSEQTAHTAGQTTQADGLAQEVDDWASALAEQTSAPAVAPAPAPAASPAAHVFQPLTNANIEGNSDIDMIMDIPVQLTVELGRTRLTIKNILQLGQGSVVELDGLAGEPMDIFVNGYLIAQGEVVVVDEKYGIRVTDIVTPSDRISRLNSRR